MQATFGDPTPAPERFEQASRLVVFTEDFQLKWSHCSATADFLSGFYAGVLSADRTSEQLNDLSHSIAYLVNELVENALKFCTTGNMEIQAGLDGDDFILRIANAIEPETSDRFQTLLAEITDGEPGDLLIQRIEANAEGGSGSGLGLLTLMSDYGARLSWHFRPAGSGDERVFLETIARLALPKANPLSPSKIPTTHRHGN